jgi:indolepyruvate ferredoxin oxidoreductase beta subunit
MDAGPPQPKAISVAILAMGGEGGGVLADWLVGMAERAGYHVQATSVPGVAQRTGATIYYVEMFPGEAARTAGAVPVLALMPVAGDVDIVVASELMEAGRAVQRGFVTQDRTTLIASTHRVYSMTEKTAMADGRVDAERLTNSAKASAKDFLAADFARIAEETGSVISAALFGALAASGRLPFPRATFEDAIRRGGVGVEASLRAFDRGFREASGEMPAPGPAPGAPKAMSAAAMAAGFPAPARATIEAGIARLIDYQDADYARAYLARLEPIKALDTDRGAKLLIEVARHLALWMAYEDIARVADLKIRRSRFERVASEARVRDGQVLRVREYLHPRLQEIADAMPAGLGRWLLGTGWAHWLLGRMTSKGRTVETTSISGFLLLYMVAGFRRWRRRSLRFEVEQARIEAWLAAIRKSAATDYELAVAIAECQQLVKGYGDTHARGLANFETVMAALPKLTGADAAARLASLRKAALADDSGGKLSEAMKELT